MAAPPNPYEELMFHMAEKIVDLLQKIAETLNRLEANQPWRSR